MKLRTLAGLVAALSLSLPAAAVAAPATVTMRVEGDAATVVPRTTVTTTTAPVNKDGDPAHTCTGTSAAGALERVTAGDWGGTWFGGGLGYAVERVRTLTPDPASEFFSFWVNWQPASTGVCGAELQSGDEVLLFEDCFGAGCTSPPPLRVTGVPAQAAAGASATLHVQAYVTASTPPFGTRAQPAAGATVTVGGRAYTTGAEGTARVAFSGSGPVAVQATKADHVRSAVERTCVACSAPPPGAPGSGPQPVAPDTSAPLGRILGIRDGQRFRRGRGPRVLRGTVGADPSGLKAVKLRLTRQVGKRCWYFSGSKERFLRRACGTRHAFKIGESADWSYLLPSRLKRGRYVLDVIAMDRERNRDVLERGRSRVVFRVR